MAASRLSVVVLCFVSMLAPTAIWSQSEDPNTDKIRALQKQLDEMKAQMAAVQTQITDLSGGKLAVATESSTGSIEENAAAQAAALNLVPARQVGQATATYDTTSQDPVAAPRIDNAPFDPRYPGYFRLPGTRTLLRIGGYFKTDFIYDLKSAGDSDRFIPSTFPIPTPSGVQNTTISIRPTRLNLDFLIPVASSSVRFFIEGDFFGSSSTTPRLRHAYAQVKNLLLGQSFSNFMDPDAGPDTLDFQGPNSQVSIRNPQLRYTFGLGEKTNLSFSVEKASSDVSFKTPEFDSLPETNAPDGAIKIRHGMGSRGHIQVAVLLRSVGAHLPDGRSESVFGWGINATGAMKLFAKDVFVYQGAYGEGMERYVNDTSGLGTDAYPTGASPHLKAIPLTAVYGAYQHYWIKNLRSSVVYGFAQTQNTDLQPGSAFHQSNYSAGNLIWNPFGSLNVGAEFLYGWIVKKDNSTGNAPRIIISAKYNFVKAGDAKGL